MSVADAPQGGVMNNQLTFYLYAEIPDTPPGWTLAVLARGRKDANTYVKAVWRGGRLVGNQATGKVNANCGGITDTAQSILHQQLEDEYAAYKRQQNGDSHERTIR